VTRRRDVSLRILLQALVAGVGVLSLRLLTDALPPEALGRLTSVSLVVALASATCTVPVLQLALRDALGRPTDRRGLVRAGTYRSVERRITIGVAIAAILVTLLLQAMGGAAELPASFALGFLGLRQWSIAKTELNGLQWDTWYQAVSLGPVVLPAFVLASVLAFGVPAGRPPIVVYFATILVSGSLVRAILATVPIPSRSGMDEPPATMVGVFRESLHGGPFALASWLVASTPRWWLAMSSGLAEFALLAAIWSPVNQAFLTVGNAILLTERPPLFAVQHQRAAMLVRVSRYARVVLVAGGLLGVALVALAPVWQSIALAPSYRTDRTIIGAVVVANLLIILGQPLEQFAFLERRQWTAWLPGIIASASVLVAVTILRPTPSVANATVVALAVCGVDLALKAAWSRLAGGPAKAGSVVC
jgi:hypothetical protein